MIIVLGDLHFRADHPWFMEAAERFLSWFEDWEENNPNNQLVLLGDLVETPTNGGIVVDYLERLYRYSKFDHIHVIVGNHDFKRIDKKYQLAYKFLERKHEVTIYNKKSEVTIQGIDCLMMPYLVSTVKMPSPNRFYSNLWKKLKEKKDIAFGHLQDINSTLPGGIKNLDKLADKVCLGHIHTRVHYNYLGSIYPLNHGQNGQRCYRSYEILNGILMEIDHKLPNFLEFIIINYGDDIKPTDALVPVYVMHKCPKEGLLDSKYDGLFIRKYFKASEKNDSASDKDLRKTTAEYFTDFLKQSSMVYDRNTVKTCKSALGI